ncbi:MAG: penicillin-binding protein activator LpoB [Treponema sp.]|jgi:hypothetical protein|nr:penicillin-binding protein activator LpoB [Treponema sp.]
MKKCFMILCFLVVGVTCAMGQSPTLNRAVRAAQKKIERKIPEGKKIAIYDIASPTIRLSLELRNDLETEFVDTGKFKIVSRADLDKVAKEMDFQYSGEVSDDAMKAMGQKVGADSIVIGEFTVIKGGYMLTVKTIDVESGELLVSYRERIPKDKGIDYLLDNTTDSASTSTGTATGTSTASTRPPRPPAPKKAYFVLGARGGIMYLFNSLNEDLFPNASSIPVIGQEYSVYFGVHGVSAPIGLVFEGNLKINSISIEDTSGNYDFSYMSLDIPVLVRLGIGGINLFAGPYMSIPLGDLKDGETNYTLSKPLGFMSSLGILGGLSVGFRLGLGYLTIQGRYMFDFNEIGVEPLQGDGDPTKLFRRHGLNATIGYEFWL